MNAPSHPADFLNEVLMPATGRSDGEIARLLGISLPVFYTILTREKPISPTTATMLGRLFNTGDEFWLKMQADFDRFTARQNVIEAGMLQVDGSARPPALGQGTAKRHLPKPSGGTYSAAPEDIVSGFDARDVVSWQRSFQGNDRSIIG